MNMVERLLSPQVTLCCCGGGCGCWFVWVSWYGGVGVGGWVCVWRAGRFASPGFLSGTPAPGFLICPALPDRGLAPYTPLPRSSGRFVGSWVRGPRRIPAGANTPPNQMMRPNSPREALRFGRFRVWHGSQYHALDPKGRASWRHGSPKESTVSPADRSMKARRG